PGIVQHGVEHGCDGESDRRWHQRWYPVGSDAKWSAHPGPQVRGEDDDHDDEHDPVICVQRGEGLARLALDDRDEAARSVAERLEEASDMRALSARSEQVEDPGDHADPDQNRSEERRVGKECRSRWAPYQ